MESNISIPSSEPVQNGKSLDFAQYLLAKTRFLAAENEFNNSKSDLDSKTITSDQIASLTKHSLDQEKIKTLTQKSLPANNGWQNDFANAIFVGFKNYEKNTTSGKENDDVFLKANGWFTTRDYNNVDPALDKGNPIFIDGTGYRFVSQGQALVKSASKIGTDFFNGGKSKKRMKRNLKAKSKRRYSK